MNAQEVRSPYPRPLSWALGTAPLPSAPWDRYRRLGTPRAPEPLQFFSPKPLILPGLFQRKPQEGLRPTASPHPFASPPTTVLPYAGSAVLPVSRGLLALTSRQSFPRWRVPPYLVKTNPQYPKNRKKKKKKKDGRERGKISPST